MSGPIDSNIDEKEKTFTGNKESDKNQYKRGKHPNSRKNLTPYPKGVSGNPEGRPHKYESLKKILNEKGDEETTNWRGESDGPRREQVWKRIWEQAISGNMKYVQLLAQLGCLDDK